MNVKRRPPNLKNIELLAHPILHSSIFGVAPREIMGKTAFKEVKKEVQARADHHCEICGRFVPHTWQTKDWIHTHEVYIVDKDTKTYYFDRFIGICKECHYFIHQGFLNVCVENGTVTEKYADDVVRRGNLLLSLIKKEKEDNEDHDDMYVMYYEGHYYTNDIFPDEAYAKYLEGCRVLHCDLVDKALPEECYYQSPS